MDSIGNNGRILAMGYYVRAFCTNPKVPHLATIQTWLREREYAAVIDDSNHAVEAAKAGESRWKIKISANKSLQPIANSAG
jgi:hypothetical protein